VATVGMIVAGLGLPVRAARAPPRRPVCREPLHCDRRLRTRRGTSADARGAARRDAAAAAGGARRRGGTHVQHASLRHQLERGRAVVALALATWELAGRTVLDREYIAPPSEIVAALPRVLDDEAIRAALAVSFYELVVAFVIAAVLGVAIGAPIGLRPFATRSALPLVLLLYSIPQVTVLPLFVLWFGVDAPSKIAFGVTHGVFPIILNVAAGARTVEKAHLGAARSMGATRLQIFRRVILPHLTPSLFAGLRLGMSATLLGVLLAELYVSSGGVGYQTRRFSESFDPAATFAIVACLALMAVVLNETARGAERRASFWRTRDGAADARNIRRKT
jgi:ABC-type nitrate/sulfonate/bicarbonate transport system permease component